MPERARQILTAELAYEVYNFQENNKEASYRTLAVGILLISAVMNRQVSIMELRRLENELEFGEFIENLAFNSMFGLNYENIDKSELALKTYTDPYLESLIKVYHSEDFIPLLEKARPNGVSGSHSVIGLARDLMKDGVIPVP